MGICQSHNVLARWGQVGGHVVSRLRSIVHEKKTKEWLSTVNPLDQAVLPLKGRAMGKEPYREERKLLAGKICACSRGAFRPGSRF